MYAIRSYYGITLQILGDARGSIMLLFPQESACRLLSCLLRRDVRALVLNELNVSALKEVGNILASAYLSAIGNLLRKTLIPSVPSLAYDMAGAVVDYVLIDLSKGGEVALMIETDFVAAGAELLSTFTFGANPVKLGRSGVADLV